MSGVNGCVKVLVMRVAVLVMLASLAAANAAAEERWVLIVSGASGGQKYAEQMREWRATLSSTFVERYGFAADKVRVFVDETVKTGEQATAVNIRRAVGELKKLTRDDMVVVVLMGHGTFDGDAAKFNLVGPDLTAEEWGTLLTGVSARMVVVNTTAASFPFLERLSGPNRIVITATDSAAQKYATVFPDYFVKALSEASSDLDKNGRTSIFEVLSAASLAVKQHYEQRGQLATERPVFDDNGDGIGREAEAPGPDGAMARLFYLNAESAAAAADPELAKLLRRQRDLEAEAEALKAKKGDMPAGEWTDAYEKLMIELARVARDIKAKS